MEEETQNILHGDIVYLRTDLDQFPRVVLRIVELPGGTKVYEVGSGLEQSAHFEVELSKDKLENDKIGF